jgi:ABC-type multidrug transport system ATPase subunit
MAAQPSDAASTEAPTKLSAQLAGVSKLFGSFAALRQVTADLEPGRCYVLIGENGAGKSTLLRILAGLLRPSFGTVKVFGGLEPHQDEARGRIGYMSHAPMLYDELTGAGEPALLSQAFIKGRPSLSPAEALRQVGLDPELQRPLGQYSQGMRQRTSLARVLLPVPELLLLDEPFPIWMWRASRRWWNCWRVSRGQPDDCDHDPPAGARRSDCRLGAGAEGRARGVV